MKIQAMSWLRRNYFLPTISPENQPAGASTSLSPISPLLAQYKHLLKMTTRDASLKSRSKPELARILRDVENWIMEAKVAATMVNFGTQEGEDGKERWALERLCDALVGRGGLVPLSKRFIYRLRVGSISHSKVSQKTAYTIPRINLTYSPSCCSLVSINPTRAFTLYNLPIHPTRSSNVLHSLSFTGGLFHLRRCYV